MGWRRGTCDHVIALSLHEGDPRFVFKNIVGQISIFGKIGFRLELKLEHCSFQRIRVELELP